MDASKASMCCGRNLRQMARNASIFSSSSLTTSAFPMAIADLYCRVKLPSFGPIVGVHLDTAERHTALLAFIQSIFSPSIAQ